MAVDIDPASPTCGRYVSVELSDERSDDNHRQLWIPGGYARGFRVLSEIADFEYKCTDLYSPEDEGGPTWNDAKVGIPWPIDNPRLSTKYTPLPTLQNLVQR